MADDSGKLLDKIAGTVGRIDGRLDGMESNIAGVRADIKLTQTEVQRHGQELAAMNVKVTEHGRRISGIVTAVREANGVAQKTRTQLASTWRTLAIVGAAVVATGGLAIALVKMLFHSGG